MVKGIKEIKKEKMSQNLLTSNVKKSPFKLPDDNIL
jgi:hypothetical protein